MTIQNILKLIPLDDIKVQRSSRQRTDLQPPAVFDLACAIAKQGVLQNIGVNSETMEVVFGERRLTAVRLIRDGHPDLSEDQRMTLNRLAQATPLYDAWSKIPARLIKGTTLALGSIEWIENVHREELPWQDKAKAAVQLHKAAAKEHNNKREESSWIPWTDADTAALLGIAPSWFSTLIAPLRELESASAKTKPKIKEALDNSASARSATNAARNIKERNNEKQKTPFDKLREAISRKPKPDPIPETKPDGPAAEQPSPIICADFHKWAASYTGAPFNFMHCDFPYGIEFNKATGPSGGFFGNAATKQQGNYDDSAAVYWSLLQTLAEHQDRLLADSCHIMFWFSQNFRRETEDFFSDQFEATVHSHLMIWHFSDAAGLVPDPNRYGRRSYETAMLITLGDRKITKPVTLSTASPKQGTNKLHRSAKPEQILRHFFSMFVDDSTNMLDPTCGAGSSLIVAKQLGAANLTGLELDPEMATTAQQQFKHSLLNN